MRSTRAEPHNSTADNSTENTARMHATCEVARVRWPPGDHAPQACGGITELTESTATEPGEPRRSAGAPQTRAAPFEVPPGTCVERAHVYTGEAARFLTPSEVGAQMQRVSGFGATHPRPPAPRSLRRPPHPPTSQAGPPAAQLSGTRACRAARRSPDAAPHRAAPRSSPLCHALLLL